MNPLIEFEITILYFKASGKYYAESKLKREFTNCGTQEHPICYMNEVVDYIKNLNPSPGLRHQWNEYILVDCEEGYPHLIISKEH